MTNNTVIITINIDEDIKTKFEQICTKLGLTTEEAINLFIEETIRQGKFPFSVDADLMHAALKETQGKK